MRVLVFLAVSLVASSVGAEAQEQRSLSACGRITAFAQATPSTDGSITIGTRTYVLRADAIYSRSGGNLQALVVGREICLNGTLDQSGAFVQYSGHGIPQPYCGRVRELRAPSASTAGSLVIQDTGVATFPIPIGTDLSNDAPSPFGAYKCYSLAVDPAGDAFVTGRFIRTVDRVVTRFKICGRVLDYVRATPTAAGAVRIGSRTMPIERGFVYTGDPAGDRTDRTMVGADVCLTGGLSAAGELIDFVTQPFEERTCGTAGSHRVPSASAEGQLVLSVPSNPDYMRLVVPTGTDLGTVAAGGDICVSFAVNPAGDAFVTGRFQPSRGGATAPSIPQLPSTSTR